MRAHIFNIVIGVLGFAALAASAPAFSPIPDDCVAPSTETVFVTLRGSLPKPSTVYVTVTASSVKDDLSKASTSTLTRFATLYSSTTSPHTVTIYLSAAKPSSTGQFNDPYRSTITETAVITVTNVNLTPLPSGGSLTYSETAAPNVVENGTTYWLDGQTPATSKSYVYATSFVTVVPVDPTEWAAEHTTRSVTLHSTIYSTKQHTLTETLKSSLTSSGKVDAVTSASFGTGLPYVKPTGGWNATKTSGAGDVYSGATNAVSGVSTGAGVIATGIPSLILYSSFDIYQTIHPTISLSSLAAKSGFNAFTTPVSYSVTGSNSDPATATSESSGIVTTTAIGSNTVTSGGSSGAASIPFDTCTENPGTYATAAPYANSTFVTSSRVSSIVSGVITSLSSVSSSVAYESSSANLSSTSSTSSVTGRSSPLNTLTGSSGFPSTAPNPTTSYSSSPIVTSYASSESGLVTSSSSTPRPSTTLSLSSSQSAYSSFPTSSSITASSSSATLSSAIVSSSSSLPTSVYLSKTSTSSTASATPSVCGEHGDFVLNFDDIPPLSIGNQDPNTVQPEPVFNPYHQFDFSDGFVVVPPPTDPYLPSSPPLLLEFIPLFNVNGTNTQAGPNTAEKGYSGQISDGDADRTGCFHFNMYGAKFGCDSRVAPCEFMFSGYQLDASRNEVQITSQKVSVPACPPLANCTLTPVQLDRTFVDLAFIRINVTVNEQQPKPAIWWMDDLSLGWYNNSCETSLCRVQTHLP